MSKPRSDSLSRRRFLGSSLGAVAAASIGCGSEDDDSEPSTELGTGGSGDTTGGTGSGGAATGGTSPASGGAGAGATGTGGATTGGTGTGGAGTGATGTGGVSTGGTATGGDSSTGGAGTGGAGTGGDSGAGGADTGGAGMGGAGTGGDAGSGGAGAGNAHLAGACGIYCGACPGYNAKHSEDESIQRPNPWGDCDGCLAGGQLAAHCRTCAIRLCALDKPNVTRCCDCDELPCYRITDLINFGNYPHRQEYLPNLALISEMGVEEWVTYEAERWRCPQCGLPLLWYDTECPRCGEPRPENLFPITDDTPRPY